MGAKVIRRDEGELIESGPTVNRVVVSGADSDNRASVTEMRLDAGWEGPPPHRHDRVDHVFVVLEGRVDITVGGAQHALAPGDMAWVPRGEAHGFGTGEESGVLLAVDTPQPLDSYFRELAEAFPPGTKPDPAVAGQIMARHDTHRVT